VPSNCSRASWACVGVSVSAGLPSQYPLLLCRRRGGEQGSVQLRKEAFCGKQIFLSCSGPSASRFHQTCLRLSDSECSILAVNGVYTYQCDSCRMKQLAGRSDDTPRRSTSKTDYDSDIVARSKLYVKLHAQLESIHSIK
jgi:hypothetical protein